MSCTVDLFQSKHFHGLWKRTCEFHQHRIIAGIKKPESVSDVPTLTDNAPERNRSGARLCVIRTRRSTSPGPGVPGLFQRLLVASGCGVSDQAAGFFRLFFPGGMSRCAPSSLQLTKQVEVGSGFSRLPERLGGGKRS